MAGSLSHGKHTCFDVRFLHAEADAAERLASVDRSNQHYSWLKRLKSKRLHSWDYLLCLIFVDLTLTYFNFNLTLTFTDSDTCFLAMPLLMIVVEMKAITVA